MGCLKSDGYGEGSDRSSRGDCFKKRSVMKKLRRSRQGCELGKEEMQHPEDVARATQTKKKTCSTSVFSLRPRIHAMLDLKWSLTQF
jgi:hypothetical protein